MFGEELLLIPVLGFFCWCYDKKLGKLLGRNICAEIVCSPMIKNIALRYAVIFFADIALYPLLFDRIGRKSGQAA